MYNPIYGIIPFMVLFHLWYYSHLWYYPPYFFCKVNANERNESLLSSWRMQLNFCKVNANERNESLLSNCRVQLNFCKVNANERNESLLSNCRVQLNFCKVNANERNGKEILSFYLLRYMISIIFISIFRPCSKSFLRLRFHPHQEPAATFAHLSYIKNEAASRLYTPRCLIHYISNPG